MEFKDRVVLVLGAAGGIGRAICTQMGRGGASLGLVDRDATKLMALQEELGVANIRCVAAVADVRSREQTRAAVEKVGAQLGPVDILVAAAGVCGVSLVEDLRVDELETIMQVNFLGVVYAIEAVLPSMLERKRGQIAAIASLAAFRGIPFESAYCASKAALTSYLESLRPPLRRRGIEVTTLFPGFIRTPLLENLLAEGRAAAPPGVIEPEKAASRIVWAIRRGRRVYAFPWGLSLLVHLSRFLPARLWDRIQTRMARTFRLPY
jgi:short-subunit dehydrogenase